MMGLTTIGTTNRKCRFGGNAGQVSNPVYLFKVDCDGVFGYIRGNCVIAMDGSGVMFHRSGRYLYAADGTGAVARQKANYFYSTRDGIALWYFKQEPPE